MLYKFRVFDDPTLDNDTADDLQRVADDNSCTLSSRDFSGSLTRIRTVYGIASVMGWAVSNVWSEDET